MHLDSIDGVERPTAADKPPVAAQERDRFPLDHAELIIDNWASDLELGFRLYRLFPNYSIYGLTRYERDVDPETGDLTEDEDLVDYGFVEVDTVILPDAQAFAADHNMAFSDVEPIHNSYDHFTYTAINEELYKGESPEAVFGEYIAYAESEDVLDGMIEYDEPNPSDAEKRRRIARELAAALHPESHPVGENAVQYVARLAYDEPPEWYKRATELHLNGVLKNRPTVALVQAMDESDDERFKTQADIGEALALDQSTMSKHLDTAEEMRKRARWHAKDG